jgi:hypothetical protein
MGWAVRHSGLARSVATWADDVMGYGKPRPENQWWFDLEDVNGVLQIPTTKGSGEVK